MERSKLARSVEISKSAILAVVQRNLLAEVAKRRQALLDEIAAGAAKAVEDFLSLDLAFRHLRSSVPHEGRGYAGRPIG